MDGACFAHERLNVSTFQSKNQKRRDNLGE
jgi:hypothetical protein